MLEIYKKYVQAPSTSTQLRLSYMTKSFAGDEVQVFSFYKSSNTGHLKCSSELAESNETLGINTFIYSVELNLWCPFRLR